MNGNGVGEVIAPFEEEEDPLLTKKGREYLGRLLLLFISLILLMY
jgi:hypothetical protein